MRVFISWSGQRSRALGSALRSWLSKVIPGISFFDSEEIPKGKNWHVEVIKALRGCSIGIFCITPENLRSQWVLFEAGALAQHGDQPTLLTYIIGPVELTGPLSHFQSTRFEQEDSRRFVQALAKLAGTADDEEVLQRFNGTWDHFQSVVQETVRVRLEELIPGFFSLFEGKKTFEEPFPVCTDKRWDDRLRRTARTHHILSSAEYGKFLAGAQEVADAYEALLNALDRYDMHLGALLLKPVEYADLRQENQDLLEQARQRVVDEVRKLKELAGD
jgi:hypothetical protein